MDRHTPLHIKPISGWCPQFTLKSRTGPAFFISATERFAAPATPTEENKRDWQQRATECREQLKALQGRYAAVQQNGLMAAKALQLLAVLEADTVMLNPKRQRWLEEQRYQAEKLLSANDLSMQQKLAIQIMRLS